MNDDQVDDMEIGGLIGFLVRLYQRWPGPFLLVCALPALWVVLIQPVITTVRTGEWVTLAILGPLDILFGWMVFLMCKLHRLLHRRDHG